MRNIIALITDFKISDPFIGVMKGVILNINPEAIIVDLAHNFESHNIRAAAFKLLTSYRYFPRGTIFCCVVDPGVGTSRKAIVIKSKQYIFVGPDNGCLYPAANEDGIDSIFEIKNPRYMLPKISTTFHGRDIFAPVSAYISKGVPLANIGPPLDKTKIKTLDFGEPKISDNKIELSVITSDGFGNLFLNMRTESFPARIGSYVTIVIRDQKFKVLVGETFGDVDIGEPILIKETSHGFLELAINQGSARNKFKLMDGDKITIII